MTTILIALSALIVFGALYLLLGFRVFSEFAKRNDKNRPNLEQEGVGICRDWIAAQKGETLQMKNSEGMTLSGLLIRAAKPRGTTVLLLHGYLGNGVDHMGMFAPFYLAHGFDVFLPDHRAHGKSEGKYIGFGKTDAEDCTQWCRHLVSHYPEGQRLILHGISMGGSTACTASSNRDLPKAVCGIVSDCAFSSCKEQFTESLSHIVKIPAKFILPAANVWCKQLAGYDLFCASAAEAVKDSTLPFLFIHGKEDRFVPTRMAETLFNACPDEHKELWLVPNARHFESYLLHPEEYEKRLSAFFERIGA